MINLRKSKATYHQILRLSDKEYIIHNTRSRVRGKYNTVSRINAHTFKKNGYHAENVLAIIFHSDKKIIINAFTIRGLDKFRQAQGKDKWRYLGSLVASKLLAEKKCGYELYASEENMDFWKHINTWNDYLINKI